MAWLTPRTWVAGEVVTAGLLNTHIRDNLNALGEPWSTYVPGLVNITLGNGTLSGRTRQVGKTVDVWIDLIFGTTTAVTSTAGIGLPVQPRLVNPYMPLSGTATLIDTSAGARRIWSPVQVAASGLAYAGAGDASGSLIAAAVPWTWGAGDRITIDLRFESA